MTSRFITNFALFIAAAFCVVACFAFSMPDFGWIAFGTGCAAVVVALTGFALRRRGSFQRVLDACTVAAGGWLIVASRTFALGHVKWIGFGDACLLAGLAAIGLIAHEAARARAVQTAAAAASASARTPGRAENGHRYGEFGHSTGAFNPHPAGAGRN